MAGAKQPDQFYIDMATRCIALHDRRASVAGSVFGGHGPKSFDAVRYADGRRLQDLNPGCCEVEKPWIIRLFECAPTGRAARVHLSWNRLYRKKTKAWDQPHREVFVVRDDGSVCTDDSVFPSMRRQDQLQIRDPRLETVDAADDTLNSSASLPRG